MSVAGLLLAAGAGRRFGRPKAEVELGGQRLVDIGVRTLTTGGCEPVVVVGGAADLTVPGATVVPNPDWPSGLGSSLRAGLSALDGLADPHGSPVEAAVVLLVDIPWVSAGAVRRVVAVAGHSPAAIATYEGRRGHPVLLSRVVWSDVAALAVGDIGAKAWLTAHPDDVLDVDCTGLGDPRDIDRPEDLDPRVRPVSPHQPAPHQPAPHQPAPHQP